MNTTLKWIIENMGNKITINERITNASEPVIGIYGIFVKENVEEYCAYVGRSNNVYRRMFSGDDAHIVKLKKGICENTVINEAMNNDAKMIIVKLLESVQYDYKNYNVDMQKLASRENYWIDYYQKLNQCLEQRPDGSNMEYYVWETRKNNK